MNANGNNEEYTEKVKAHLVQMGVTLPTFDFSTPEDYQAFQEFCEEAQRVDEPPESAASMWRDQIESWDASPIQERSSGFKI